MPCLIPLTEWQAEVARRALDILGRSRGRTPAGFVLSDRTLTVPDDDTERRSFVHHAVCRVEDDLDRAVAAGEITGQRKATLRRSMIGLEDKIENPEHARAKRA